MTDRTRLTGCTAAGYVSDDIIFIDSFRQVQRLANNQLKRLESEILCHLAAIDGNLAVSGNEANTGNRGLAATRSVVSDLCH